VIEKEIINAGMSITTLSNWQHCQLTILSIKNIKQSYIWYYNINYFIISIIILSIKNIKHIIDNIVIEKEIRKKEKNEEGVNQVAVVFVADTNYLTHGCGLEMA